MLALFQQSIIKNKLTNIYTDIVIHKDLCTIIGFKDRITVSRNSYGIHVVPSVCCRD